MKPQIPHFEQARVLIAGDVMLDRYWYGPCSRVSPEAPVPVVKVEEVEERPGGAANVAVNIATSAVGFGCWAWLAPTKPRRCWKPSCNGWARRVS